MKTLPTIALALALAVGGTSLAQPAFAQNKKEEAQPAEKERKISRGAQKPFVELQTALNAKDDAAFQKALPAAQAAAKSPEDRYVLGQFRLQHAINKQDDAAAIEAINAMLASGDGTQQETITAYQNLISLNNRMKNAAGANAAMAKLAELQPDNPDIMISMAAQRAQSDAAGSVPLFVKAIEAKKATGQPVDSSWYMSGLKAAYEAKQRPQAIAIGRGLVTDYPTPDNWKAVLQVYRELSPMDANTEIDFLRLMRNAKAMGGERDYYDLADALNNRGLPGEAKAVLDEGVSARVVSPTKTGFAELIAQAGQRSTTDRASLAGEEKKAMAAANGTAALGVADAYFGYGDHAKAVSLYKAALQKGGVDANVVNTRLGIALGMAGQKAEAETAFKAVTGQRADLAGFWLLWLSQRG